MKSICPKSTSNKCNSDQNGLKQIIYDGSAISNSENNLHTTTDISIQEEDGLSFVDNADEDNNIDNE